MVSRRRFVAAAALFVAVLAVVLWVVLHSRGLQREMFDRATTAIEAATGWRVDADEVRLRAWPAHLVLEHVTVSAGDRRVASVEQIETTWAWRRLVGAPRHLETVTLRGVEADFRGVELPEAAAGGAETTGDPWRAVEIGRLVLERGSVDAGAFDVEGSLDGIRIECSMLDARAEVAVDAERFLLVREDRQLDLGRVELRGSASAAAIVVERMFVDGPGVGLKASAEIVLGDAMSGRGTFAARADVAEAVGWWDPNLGSGLDFGGVLDVEGRAEFDPSSGISATAGHRGEPLRIVGYELHQVEVGVVDGVPTVRLAGPAWGEASITPIGESTVRVAAKFDDVRLEPVLDLFAPRATGVLGRPIRLSGTLDGTAGLPVLVDTLSGTVDIAVRTPDGRLEVAANGAGDTWNVESLAVDTSWARVDGAGGIGPAGRLDAEVELELSDVGRAGELAAAWIVPPAGLTLAGGPITGGLTLSGTLADPRYRGQLEWQRPVVSGAELERILARASGDRRRGDWSIELRAGRTSSAAAEGTIELGESRIAGRWRLDLDELAEVFALAPFEVGAVPEVSGRLKGDGDLEWAPDGWLVGGQISARQVEVDAWRLDEIDMVFDVGPETVAVHTLQARLLGGELDGGARIGLAGADAPLAATFNWRGLDLEHIPVELPVAGAGTMAGRVELAGSVGRPSGGFEIEWAPSDPGSRVPALGVEGALENGLLRLATREIEAGGGAGTVRATIPLGAFNRPAWLWPNAPDEPVRVVADGRDLSSDALLALVGTGFPQATATGRLTLDATWHPRDPNQTRALAVLNDLRVESIGGELAARGPVELRVDGSGVQLDPVVLEGTRSDIRVGGGFDFETGELDGRVEAVLAPAISRLIPFPVQIYEPVRMSAVVSGSIDAPRAAIMLEHPDGVLVVRDPPLQIRDLVLSAEIVDNVLWINDGHAEVNQGRVELAGGWDPESGQGVIAEAENVLVFVEGILSQWSGTIAIEPDRERLARVVGELNLVAGLWDQDVNLSGMLLGPASLDPAGDDPLHDVVLNLDVRGRGSVRVDNNLGRFDARWDVLRVTGSAAAPRVRGEITIAPGGSLALGGQRVAVRRGRLVFTGDPGIDPVVEIVPESDLAAFGSGGDGIDTTNLAAQGLVSGLAGALGFENETLQPAEISVEVEKDSAEQLMLGQRLSHNLALFFASNTRDVQDRTSLVQLWNIPGLKGLAIQGYQKTLTDEAGGNVVQRFQWGGNSLYEERPTIRKLKLEGEWPIGTRRLKKATGFRRGQPYDPFLPFVGKVRMERELAAAGFQLAAVSARAVESNNAWVMVFQCDAGERQTVVFEGHEPPRRIREEVTALYQPPPLEGLAFRNMRSLLDRHYAQAGYPKTDITVDRRGDAVIARIDRSAGVELSGPVLAGAPDEVTQALRARLGSPAELALLSADVARANRVVERVLNDLGYPNARISSVTTVEVSDGRSEIRIDAELGRPAVVDELVVTGDDPLGLTRADDFRLAEGRRIDRSAVDLAASQIRAAYDAAGYSDVVVSAEFDTTDDGQSRVDIVIEPGRRRTVTDIEITGIRHTGEKVLRSGIAVEEGEILRNSDLDTTAIRIANFAPIERVDVRTKPLGADGAKVELEIAEKPRWTAEVGGGWSTERGAQVRFGLRDDNLIGRGLSLNLRGRWDQTEWLGFVVASLPPPPGRRLALTSTAGFSRGEAPGDPDFNQDELFWSAEVTRWMGRGDLAVGTAGEQITGYYRFTRTRFYGLLDTGFITVEIDTTNDTGFLGARYVHDRFDSSFDPTSGYAVIVDAGWADEYLASDLTYWTTFGSGSTAFGAPFGSTVIQTLRLGITEPLHGQDLVRQNKFFAGGQGSIRGFDRDSVGPVIDGGDDWDPAGGGALFIFNQEVRIPVRGGLRAAVFADVGRVWESWNDADWDLAVGAGVGIRWATPIGPVWADIAWPVVNPWVNDPGIELPFGFPDNRRMSSSKPKFYVGIGRPF